MNKLRLFSLLLTTLCATVTANTARSAEVAGVFSQGRTHFSVFGGTGYAFDDTYFVLGVGASYFLTDGLNIGVQWESWTGGDPGLTKLTPSVQYVFYQIPRVHPYVGAFYRRVYVEDAEDVDSAGGRAGAYFAASRNVYFGAGVVYESYRDCNETVYRECSDTYPEFILSFVF